jgi:hypothetical protein
MTSQTAMSASPAYQARRGSTGYAEGEAGADRARVLGRGLCARLLPRRWLCSGILADHFRTLRSQPLLPPDLSFWKGREDRGKGRRDDFSDPHALDTLAEGITVEGISVAKERGRRGVVGKINHLPVGRILARDKKLPAFSRPCFRS